MTIAPHRTSSAPVTAIEARLLDPARRWHRHPRAWRRPRSASIVTRSSRISRARAPERAPTRAPTVAGRPSACKARWNWRSVRPQNSPANRPPIAATTLAISAWRGGVRSQRQGDSADIFGGEGDADQDQGDRRARHRQQSRDRREAGRRHQRGQRAPRRPRRPAARRRTARHSRQAVRLVPTRLEAPQTKKTAGTIRTRYGETSRVRIAATPRETRKANKAQTQSGVWRGCRRPASRTLLASQSRDGRLHAYFTAAAIAASAAG